MKVDLLMLTISLALFTASCLMPFVANTRADPDEKSALALCDVVLTVLSLIGAIVSIKPHFVGSLIVIGAYLTLSVPWLLLTPTGWDPYGKRRKRQAAKS